MNIKEISLSLLKEYENNPRNNDLAVEKVKYSIERFGFLFPVIIDQNNVIVCGHTRVRACRAMGIQTIPCIVADELTEEQINLFRLVDNKTSEYSDWDFDKLKSELSQIDLTLDANQLLLDRFELSATVFDMDLECGELKIPTFNFLGNGKPAPAPKEDKKPPVSTVSYPMPTPASEPETPTQPVSEPEIPPQTVPEPEIPMESDSVQPMEVNPQVSATPNPSAPVKSGNPSNAAPNPVEPPLSSPAPISAQTPEKNDEAAKEPEAKANFKPPMLIQFRFGEIAFFISQIELDSLNAKYVKYLDSGEMTKTSFVQYLLGGIANA